MNKKKTSIYIISCLVILWLLIFLSRIPSNKYYYIIDINDEQYPQWCNSEWLENPEDFCIFSLYGDNSRVGRGNDNSWTMYISPSKFEAVLDWNLVFEYCDNLNLGGVTWEAPLSHDASWSDMVEAQNKIYNLKARWSSKPNHYWADIRSEPTPTRNNCRLDWACWSEKSEVPLSVRCIAREKPIFKSFSLANIKINCIYYTNKIMQLFK